MRGLLFSVCTAAFILASCTPEETDHRNLSIATASNFLPAMEQLSTEFEKQTGISVELIGGSSGSLYAQIVNGAPADIFFSADLERPRALLDNGIGIGEPIFYASGTLLFWYPKNEGPLRFEEMFTDGLRRGYVAVANPDLAPYGRAAEQSISAIDSQEFDRDRIVVAENISQSLQFVKSGGARAGFISNSQKKLSDITSNIVEVPHELYDPIEQYALIISNEELSERYMEFLASIRGQRILDEWGYGYVQP